MLRISGLFFVKGWERADNDCNFFGAVWETITIPPDHAEDAVCQLVALMQTDTVDDSNEVSIDLKIWRDAPTDGTVYQLSQPQPPVVRGRNRFAVIPVPAGYLSSPGDHVITASINDGEPMAYVRVTVNSAG